MAWTDEMVEDLRRMWKEGLTTGEIGKRLNVSKTLLWARFIVWDCPAAPLRLKERRRTDRTQNQGSACQTN